MEESQAWFNSKELNALVPDFERAAREQQDACKLQHSLLGVFKRDIETLEGKLNEYNVGAFPAQLDNGWVIEWSPIFKRIMLAMDMNSKSTPLGKCPHNVLRSAQAQNCLGVLMMQTVMASRDAE